jgi:hypothetical protein
MRISLHRYNSLLETTVDFYTLRYRFTYLVSILNTKVLVNYLSLV